MSSHHFVTVCVVCVLCAAHTPCSAHTDLSSATTKISWSSADSMQAVPIEWREESSSGSPDSVTGPRIEHIAASESGRKVKNVKPTVTKKYSHSYSEEKASRLAARSENKVSEKVIMSSEINERLGQLPDTSVNFEQTSDAASMKKPRKSRNAEIDEKYYTKKLFDAYGDGTSLSIDGFGKLLKKLGLFRLIENIEKFDDTSVHENRGTSSKVDETDSQEIGLIEANSISSQQRQCINSDELLSTISQNSSYTRINKKSSSTVTNLPEWLFLRVCPVLIYHLAGNTRSEREGCIVPMNAYSPTMTGQIDELFSAEDANANNEEVRNMVQVWTYSTISIVIISVSGLLGMFVVPFMGKRYYHQVLQFFVALAIGTLCGDALIHLLPHAMMSPHSHSHDTFVGQKDEINTETEHNLNMWKGLTAMIGLIIFFFTEKALAMIAEWRKHSQRKNKLPSRVRVMRETDGANSNNVGEKLCKHKYSSYPYCYGEITTETRDNHHDHVHNDHERPLTIDEEKPLTSKSNSVTKITSKENCEVDKTLMKNNLPADDWRLENENGQSRNIDKTTNIGNNTVSIVKSEIPDESVFNGSESYTVIIREHENKHHGHTHSHGHVHAAPESMSSVAWMVVMGDGLHNFTDGMAIGAAFAANIAGGFSTAIAVFCHELPHELGDFAVLLKAGMSWKQALFYNLLSSVLCLFGMIIGVLLGATPSATSWIFAAAAGMFIYIALVDMIPELSSSHSEEGGSRWECVLQALGLLTGLGIMLIIALYEHDLKNIFSD